MYKKQINYTALFKPKASLLAVRREKTLSKLINASYSFMPNERYDFDKNCNRIKAEFQNKEQTYKTAEYNRLISDNDSEYKYDLEGNRIAKISKDGSTIKYYWDNRNRLAKVDTPNGSIEYIYDHQNRLVLRKQGENTTTFIHDGWQIVLQFDNDKPTHRYLWGTKQDELICDNDNWTLCDHLNTIRDIVKSDGTVTDHLEYNSFGKIISATKNDSQLQFAYTGKLTDKVSDLQWNINRWYDAKIGRWVSEDPIKFHGADVNLYRYTRNVALSTFDTSGHLIQFAVGGAYYVINGTTVAWAAASAFSTGYTFYDIATSPPVATANYGDGSQIGPMSFFLSIADLTPRLNQLDQSLTKKKSQQIPVYPNSYMETCVAYNGYTSVDISVEFDLYEQGTFGRQNIYTSSNTLKFSRQTILSLINSENRISMEFQEDIMFRIHYISGAIFNGAKIEASKYISGVPFTVDGSATDSYTTTVEVYADMKVTLSGRSSTNVGNTVSTIFGGTIFVQSFANRHVGNFTVLP